MSKAGKRSLIICIVILAAASGSAVYYFMNHVKMTLAGLSLMLALVLLAISITCMVGALQDSLKTTLYAYENIGLIGGILFASVLLAVLFERFLFCIRTGDFSMDSAFQAIVSFPREFSYYAVFVIVIVCILLGISNIALIRHEGFCLHNALSLLVAAFYIGGTFVAYAVSDLLEKYVFNSANGSTGSLPLVLNTVIPMFILLMISYFECILVGTAVMGWKAAQTKPSYDKDYMIILGCSIDKRGGLLPLLKGRVNRAIRFAWEQEIQTGKPMKYVPSGGQGPNEIISEGSAMELYLLSHGAEDYEVFPEKKSVNTWENMCFSKKVIDELKPNAKVAFATTNYHILRSGILARKAGLDAEGVAGDTKWYFWPNGFVREFFGILALNTKATVITASVLAVVCTVIGLIGYLGGYIS